MENVGKTFKLTIATDNAAFDETASFELARILRDIANSIEGQSDDSLWAFKTVRDENGNEVGHFALKPNDYK